MNPLADLAADWPEISRLLDEALTRPAPEREAWLAGQPALTAPVRQAVQRLLAQRASVETGDFMATLPPLRLHTAATSEGPAAGDRVGPWLLLDELGQGGMGSVWLAERADGSFKRRVALKLPRLSWARGLAERMARERDILATLEHPLIARLYDAGVDEQGLPWLALEHVQGRPIDAYCRDAAMPLARRLELLLQVCEAVGYAHSRLVVHRDLKPNNILVADDGQVRLLDFGIAKLLDGEQASESALTMAAGRALTPDYASPEQVRGEPLGTGSDVYSLGVVAYELLAGVRPYRPRRASAAALEDAIERDDAPPASRACGDVARSRALRGDLDVILAKALRKQPAERYASVDAFAQDLRRHLAHEPVQAQPDRLAYLAGKFLRRHAVPVAAAAAVAVALAVGLGVALSQAEAARSSAVQAQAQSARAEAAGALAAAREDQARQAEANARAAANDAERERLRAERAAQAERRAAAAATASAQQAQKEASRSGVVSNLLLNTFGRVAADPGFRTAEARERMGTALRAELDTIESHAARTPSGVAEANGAAASIFNYLQQPENQLRAARREQQLLVVAGESPLRIAESHRQLALALSRRQDFGSALVEISAGLAALATRSTPDAHVMKGRLHRAGGRYERLLGQAGRAYKSTAAAVQAFEGLGPLQLAPALHHLGAALADHAVTAVAVERDVEALEALARVERLYGPRPAGLREADHADVAFARCNVEIALQRPAAAAQACQRALQLYAPQFGAVGSNADVVDYVRATALVRSGSLDEAEAVLRRIREGSTGVVAWLPSAEWALAKGELAQAEAWLAQQQAHRSQELAPRRMEYHRLMVELRLAQGRAGEAVTEARAALAWSVQAIPGSRRAQREMREALARAEAARTGQQEFSPAAR